MNSAITPFLLHSFLDVGPPFQGAAIFSHFQQWQLTVRDMVRVKVRVRVSRLVVAISRSIPWNDHEWRRMADPFGMADPSEWRTRAIFSCHQVRCAACLSGEVFSWSSEDRCSGRWSSSSVCWVSIDIAEANLLLPWHIEDHPVWQPCCLHCRFFTCEIVIQNAVVDYD